MNLGALAMIYQGVSALYFVGTLVFGIAIFRARILSRGGCPACPIGGFGDHHGCAASAPARAVGGHADGVRPDLAGICTLH